MVLQAQYLLFLGFSFFLFFVWVLSAHAADISGKVSDEQGNGILQAVVFVQTTPPGKAMPPPTHKTNLDQIDKQFVPRLLAIPVGTEVQFPNHDQIHHHVYSLSRTKSFNVPLYKGEAVPSVLFDQPGVVEVGCNIHDWMSATILVVPSLYYATTDETGAFTLPGLPPGNYTLVAWHERSRVKVTDTAQAVQVADNPLAVTFTLTLKPIQERPALGGQRGYR